LVETSTGLTIRDAKPEDTVAMHRIFVSSIWEIDDSFYDQAQKEAWKNAVQADSWTTRMLELAFIVAVKENEVVGFASWSDAKLEHLYVAPNSGRQGVGSKLMQAVLTNFNDRDIELIASHNAHSLYARFGFTDQEHLIKQLGHVDVPCIRMKRPAVLNSK
jgi:putative acetyltransferase